MPCHRCSVNAKSVYTFSSNACSRKQRQELDFEQCGVSKQKYFGRGAKQEEYLPTEVISRSTKVLEGRNSCRE